MKEYSQRRKILLDYLTQGGQDATVILRGSTLKVRNHDCEFPFRQESNFHYLTGFDEPDAFAIIQRHNGIDSYRLFVQPKDPAIERWEGKRIGIDKAIKEYGAEAAYEANSFGEEVKNHLGYGRIFLGGESNEAWAEQFSNETVFHVNKTIGLQRLVKSSLELQHMRYASNVSAQGHLAAMKCVQPGMNEHRVQAELEHVFATQGCRSPAYGSIVAGGANALYLHYIENNATLNDGDLLLIDAGAEFNLYAGDITTTFPVNGKFTPHQRKLYSAVLHTQREVIAKVQPGVTLKDLQKYTRERLSHWVAMEGLVRDHEEFERQLGKYYPHGVSHHLGLDVHDLHSRGTRLVNNMVITVEPGLYIPEGDSLFPSDLQGTGIRIEDDVVVNGAHPEVISTSAQSLPRTPDEIEEFMR